MIYEFRWDEAKNKLNVKKHKIDFKEAILVFSDPNAITLNNGFRNGEQRWETIGRVNNNLILFVVHTVLNDITNTEIIRIMSARKAETNERRIYERNYLQI